MTEVSTLLAVAGAAIGVGTAAWELRGERRAWLLATAVLLVVLAVGVVTAPADGGIPPSTFVAVAGYLGIVAVLAGAGALVLRRRQTNR